MKRRNKRKLLFSTHHGSPWCCAWHERAGIHQAPGILAAGAALAAGGGRHDDGGSPEMPCRGSCAYGPRSSSIFQHHAIGRHHDRGRRATKSHRRPIPVEGRLLRPRPPRKAHSCRRQVCRWRRRTPGNRRTNYNLQKTNARTSTPDGPCSVALRISPLPCGVEAGIEVRDIVILKPQCLLKNRQSRPLVRRRVGEPLRDERPKGLVHLALDTKHREALAVANQRQQIRLAWPSAGAKIGLLLEEALDQLHAPEFFGLMQDRHHRGQECLSLPPRNGPARRLSIPSSNAAPARRGIISSGLVIGSAKKSLSVIRKSNAYFVGRKPVRAPCGGPTIRHGGVRDPRDVAHLSVAHTVTNGSGPAEARRHHVASRSNDYHETAAGTIWLQDVALQAGAHERRSPRTRAGVRIRSCRRSTPASRLHGTTESLPLAEFVNDGTDTRAHGEYKFRAPRVDHVLTVGFSGNCSES